MDDWESGAHRRRPTPYPAAELPTFDGMAAIERQLKERLSHLDAGAEEAPEAPGHLRFWVGGQQYSTPLSGLRQALTSLPAVSPLPYSPPWLFGLFPLRSDFVALLDLRALLGDVTATGKLDRAESGYEASYIDQALLVGEDGRLIAFGVDRIGQIANLREPHAQPGDVSEIHGSSARYTGANVSSDAPDPAGVIVLDLAQTYDDAIAQLEEWGRHV